MKKIFIFLLFILFLVRPVYAVNVNQYGIRIADFMVDILPPNLGNQYYANEWQKALDNLTTASPNGEITHVQVRTFWRIANVTNQTSWNYPEFGANDGPSGGQQMMCDNWKKWVFGYPTEPTYGPSIAERIHNAGFKLEFCLGTAWAGTDTMAGVIPVLHDQPEANYPSFDGELFLQNYMDNVLRPTAQFLASNPNFKDGDIFMMSFEMSYPVAQFSWNHNAKWISMIDEIRQIFVNAGKPRVLLTIDTNGWWDDFGLGAAGLQKLIDAGLAPNNQFVAGDIRAVGISGATYYSHLDFLSTSHWVGLLTTSQVPTTWDESYVDSLIIPAWHNDLQWVKAGTGHGMISGQPGRDVINDYWAVSQALGIPVLTNTGWTNGHAHMASGNPAGGGGGSYDNMAQKVAWMAQIKAIGNNSWSAGQDFERYCEDKSTGTSVSTSWRNSIAQPAIIQGIRDILQGLSGHLSITGILRDKNNNPIQADIILYQSGTDNIVNSTTTVGGSYNLLVSSGLYDLKYNITDFFIKMLSINMTSSLSDPINYVIKNNQSTSFSFDTSNSRLIQTYISQKPYRVLLDGAVISNVSSYSQLTDNTWFYESNNLYVKTGPSCNCDSSWTNGACNAGGCINQRQQTRTCTPSGCVPSDGQGLSRCVDDSSCIVTCPNGVCATGENCPSDATSCSEEPPVCYSRTCVNGCNNPPNPIASGQQDSEGSNRCDNTLGCSSPPCQCNGSGSCISKPTSVQVTSCDSTTSWTFSYCSYSIRTDDKIEGTGSLNATGTTSGWNAYPTLDQSGTWNWVSYQTVSFWIKTNDSSKIASFLVYTDWSNYNSYTFNSQLSSNNWVEVKINLSNPTSHTGAINFNSINFIRFELGNENKNTIYWLIDDIRIS